MTFENPIPHRATAFIALGGNLCEPERQIARTFADLGALPATRLVACSSLYRSAPVGFREQPDFINAVVQVETGLNARDLLRHLLELEQRRGRVREFRNAPRILDLDLLLHGDRAFHDPELTLPHPRMHERAFVLLPLCEIAPHCVIPGRGAAADLLVCCAGQPIEKITESQGLVAAAAAG